MRQAYDYWQDQPGSRLLWVGRAAFPREGASQPHPARFLGRTPATAPGSGSLEGGIPESFAPCELNSRFAVGPYWASLEHPPMIGRGFISVLSTELSAPIGESRCASPRHRPRSPAVECLPPGRSPGVVRGCLCSLIRLHASCIRTGLHIPGRPPAFVLPEAALLKHRFARCSSSDSGLGSVSRRRSPLRRRCRLRSRPACRSTNYYSPSIRTASSVARSRA